MLEREPREPVNRGATLLPPLMRHWLLLSHSSAARVSALHVPHTPATLR